MTKASRSAKRPTPPRRLEAGEPVVELQRILSPADAQRAFTLLLRSGIPHGFTDEGCLHRAHAGAKLLEDAGFFSEKAFCIRPPDSGDLFIECDTHPIGFTLASFHVAPSVQVRDPRSGKVERLVLDPSLFDEPVPVGTWMSTMRTLDDQPLELVIRPRFCMALQSPADANEWRPAELDSAFAWNTEHAKLRADFERMDFHAYLKSLVRKAGDKRHGLKGEADAP